MDRIEIRGLRAFGHHGVYPEEQRDGQTFVVDVDVEADLAAAQSSDDLADTIDYGVLARRLGDRVASSRFDLVEALAGDLADLVLADPKVHSARVRVAKPEVASKVECADVAVVVHRSRS